MMKLILIFIAVTISNFSLYAQNKTIKGKVISNFLETAPGVSIRINDTIEVGKTDLNGFFSVEIPVSMKKISLRDVGFELTTIELVDKCDEIEVILLLQGTNCFMSLKKSDRLRMKRFKKLPEMHKEAFRRGLFKTEEACYNLVFEPFYKKKK